MFQWLGKSVDKFNQVVTEGNYRLPPMTWGRLIRGMKPELPATSEVAVGTTMIETGKSLGERFLWASAIAVLTISALKWAALGFAVVGLGVYTAEYFRAKKSREDEITEINFAGQRVVGKRADLYRLHRAQLRIMNISDSLNSATGTTAEAIRDILNSVKEERARVKVLDGGRYGAGKGAYAFSEPDFRLVLDEEELPEPPVKPADPAQTTTPTQIADLSLRTGWDSRRCTADEFVDRLAALQEALPPDIADRLQERLQARKNAPGQ